MASLLLGWPNSFPTDTDAHASGGEGKKKKKVPKVAVYVSGAAFAITAGLTLLVLPYVRQAAKQTNPTQFVSNRNWHRLYPPVRLSPTPPAAASSSSSSQSSTSSLAPSTPSIPSVPSSSSSSSSSQPQLSSWPAAPSPQPLPLPLNPILPISKDKLFNDREERKLYGSTLASAASGESDGKSEPVSPFLGFQALGIATAIVLGSAGVGAWVVAKLLGVNDMTEFSNKMREGLQTSMPVLVSSVNKPGRSTDGLDGQAIDSWVAKIQEDDEREQPT